MDEEIKDKEDVIEDQNDSEKDNEDVIEDKEDVIEDQNDYDKGVDDRIYRMVERMDARLDSLEKNILSIKDSTSQFVEAGGVIREDNELDIREDSYDDAYVPIEELDLNL